LLDGVRPFSLSCQLAPTVVELFSQERDLFPLRRDRLVFGGNEVVRSTSGLVRSDFRSVMDGMIAQRKTPQPEG
jgi:hypothetical protein